MHNLYFWYSYKWSTLTNLLKIIADIKILDSNFVTIVVVVVVVV